MKNFLKKFIHRRQAMLVTTLFLAILAGFLLFTETTLAKECTTTFCGGGLREGLEKTKPELRGKGISTSDSLITVILGLVEFSLPFAGLLAFVGIIYGGFLEISASLQGEDGGKAKSIMIASGIGLVIIFLAYPFVATLIKFQS